MNRDAGLSVREAAALEVLRGDGHVDPLELLAAVVWPDTELAVASEGVTRRRPPVSSAEVELVLELRRQGLTFSAVATQVGRSAATCKDVARRRGMMTASPVRP